MLSGLDSHLLVQIFFFGSDPDDEETIMLELRHELVHTTILAEMYKEDLEEAEKIIQQKDQINESQNATIRQLVPREYWVEGKVKWVFLFSFSNAQQNGASLY